MQTLKRLFFVSFLLVVCAAAWLRTSPYWTLVEISQGVQTKDDAKETYGSGPIVHMLIGGRFPSRRAINNQDWKAFNLKLSTQLVDRRAFH